MSYTVHSGDTLSAIANRYHVSLSALEKANPQIRNPNNISVGEHLNIPGQSDGFAASSSTTYTVKRGESLSSIATHHGVSLAALEKANPQIKNFNSISVGQKITIPGKGSTTKPASPAPAKATNYTVRSGDTMSTIASRHGVSLAALEHANPQIKNFSRINVGQVVHIPAGGSVSHTTGSTGSAGGTSAADKAKKYLGRYESDLQRAGVTKPCPTSESCANFVSSMLQQAGAINFHTLGVADLNSKLRARGWHTVSLANAKPGDVWICNGAHGESHTEIVASNNNGHITLIGSNNHPVSSNQQINYDSYSASISGSFILAP